MGKHRKERYAIEWPCPVCAVSLVVSEATVFALWPMIDTVTRVFGQGDIAEAWLPRDLLEKFEELVEAHEALHSRQMVRALQHTTSVTVRDDA